MCIISTAVMIFCTQQLCRSRTRIISKNTYFVFSAVNVLKLRAESAMNESLEIERQFELLQSVKHYFFEFVLYHDGFISDYGNLTALYTEVDKEFTVPRTMDRGWSESRCELYKDNFPNVAQSIVRQRKRISIAGIGGDSHNASSRGSIAPAGEDVIVLPLIKTSLNNRKTDSFLDDDILKYLHREVDEEAIETEFDIKRRYVLEEALRTRPERPHGVEMQTLLRELKVPAVSLGDWLHIPRVFSRKNAQFSLPIDSNDLEKLTPMKYAARYVNLKKSKQLLYLTVLRKFRPGAYRMPIRDIEEGLMLMMGGILSADQASQLKCIMRWEGYEDEENIEDEIKLTLPDTGRKHVPAGGDAEESNANTLKYRTWCGVCAICERMFGRLPQREKDPPDGIELSDFTMLETKLAILKVHSGLVEILNTIRTR